MTQENILLRTGVVIVVRDGELVGSITHDNEGGEHWVPVLPPDGHGNVTVFTGEGLPAYSQDSPLVVDLDYPWGEVRVPDWALCVQEVDAACDECPGIGHPYCTPGWEDRVNKAGGVVLAGPILTPYAWKALVAFPPQTRR